MEENTTENRVVGTKDILKHYFASVFLYGVIFMFYLFCPLYYETVTSDLIDYSVVFGLLYVGYILIAPIIFLTVRPKSILESRNVKILGYFKRQFKISKTVQEHLQKLAPTECEKQALATLFVQAFFAIYTVNILCNDHLASFKYNLDFMGVMFNEASQYAANNGILLGIVQFVNDTSDMMLKFTVGLTLIVYTISYLTDTVFLKNKIKSVDTTPLGMISCLICYYPIFILTSRIITMNNSEMPMMQNAHLLAVLNIIIILANIGSLIAVLSLGTKAGNLTNRGIVTRFPYNIVRHPDYMMQIIFLIVSSIPIFFSKELSIFSIFLYLIGVITWLVIYYLRAVTEERHLLNDPEYQAYVEKVKYRFIPKLF